jgi:tetratricopeptide (TPR) repeat protein
LPADRPAVGDRPGAGTRPGQLPADRPGIADRPGAGTRPGQLPAGGAGIAAGVGAGLGALAGNRIGERPAQLPGLDRGDRREQFQNNRQDWVADRHDNLQNRLDNRQDFRQDWQNNRQDFMNDRRDDWQDQLDNRYPWHGDWHHGYWAGNYGGYWEHMWEQHPVWSAFAVTGWALNSVGYMFGTSDYYNPYYDTAYAAAAPYDYSQPIVIYSEPTQVVNATTPATPPAEAASLPPGVSQESLDQFEQARIVFSQGDYAKALALADQALKSMPSDATLHEFRALCLFALGRYREAAITLNAVLSVGPGWDWTTMASLYPDVEVYTEQLRKLETYAKAHPDSADAQFVLAYHYLTTGSPEAAAKRFGQVVKLMPNDTVAKQLYEGLTYKPADEVKPKAEPAAPTGPQVKPEEMVGTWKAKGPSNAAFEMTLTKEGEFTWKYARGKKEQVVKGAYAIDKNTLAMEPASGGVMLADLTPGSQGAVDFKMIGAPEKEPPLRFTR